MSVLHNGKYRAKINLKAQKSLKISKVLRKYLIIK